MMVTFSQIKKYDRSRRPMLEQSAQEEVRNSTLEPLNLEGLE